MKYIVEVNAKWLVSIEAESLRKATEEMNNAEEHARNMTRHLGRQPE